MVDHNSVWQVSFQRGKLNTDIHREDTEETQGEDGYLKAKERGLEHLIYSQLSEGPRSARDWIVAFWPPEPWDASLSSAIQQPTIVLG